MLNLVAKELNHLNRVTNLQTALEESNRRSSQINLRIWESSSLRLTTINQIQIQNHSLLCLHPPRHTFKRLQWQITHPRTGCSIMEVISMVTSLPHHLSTLLLMFLYSKPAEVLTARILSSASIPLQVWAPTAILINIRSPWKDKWAAVLAWHNNSQLRVLNRHLWIFELLWRKML